MLPVNVHPEAYDDLESARSWYEEKTQNLGIDFLKEIDYAIDTIQKSPITWAWYDKSKNVRRFLVHRFPFAVIYRINPANIQIIAVMHLHRHPDYWKRR